MPAVSAPSMSARRVGGRRAVVAVVLLVTTLVVPVLGPFGAVAGGQVPDEVLPPLLDRVVDLDAARYEAPVPGRVLQGFASPLTPYGAGHRGVDLAAPPGSTVRAAADGEVSFAGSVAGTTWISIHHRDGVITSYGPLADLRVHYGDPVGRGDPIGVLATGGHGHLGADDGLHWGARRDGRYIDPLSLLTQGTPRPSLVGDGAWRGSDHLVVPYEPWDGGRLGGWWVSSSPTADRQGFPVPPSPNHLVLVPGLGTSSDSEVLDPDHLGYDPRSVTRFSYAGRHDDPGDPDDPQRDQRRYGPPDTWPGVEVAARRLEDQLRAQAEREPGRPVDLVGHSMGGVTILYYLAMHHDAYDSTLPPIGNVVTIASPLDGSDLASIGKNVRDGLITGPLSRHLQHRHDLGRDLLLDAPAIDELAVGSDLLWDLAVAWEQAVHDGTSGPLGTGTRVLNIGGSRDLVVASDRTTQPGTYLHDSGRTPSYSLEEMLDGSVPSTAYGPGSPTADIDGERVVDHRVLPGGHSSVLDTEAVREVVWRFLADEEVVDSPGHLSMRFGSELQDSARLGQEVFSIVGPLSRVFRYGARGMPPMGPP